MVRAKWEKRGPIIGNQVKILNSPAAVSSSFAGTHKSTEPTAREGVPRGNKSEDLPCVSPAPTSRKSGGLFNIYTDKSKRYAAGLAVRSVHRGQEMNQLSEHSRPHSVWFAAVAVLFLLHGMGAAAQKPQPPQRDTTAVRHVGAAQISARKAVQNLSSSQPLQTLNRETLEALRLEGVAEAVKRFAGTNVKDYGGLGGMKTVSVRNLGAQHTAVSYDGIVVSNTQAGQIDIGRYAMENIGTLQLAIGGTNDLLQSARHYASAGLLDIWSEQPESGKKNPCHWRTTLKTGAFGLLSPSLKYETLIGGRTAVSVYGNYMRADGTYPYRLYNARTVTNEKRYNSDIESEQGELNLVHQTADSTTLRAKVSYFHSERGLPGAVIYYLKRSEERMWDEDFFSQLSLRKRLKPRWQMELRAKYTHSYNKYTDPREKQYDVDRQDEYYASGTLLWQPAPSLQIALAEDAAVNTLRNNINSNVETAPANPTRLTSLTALTAQWKPRRWEIKGYVVTTASTEHVETGSAQPDRFRLSPTLSASYRLLRDHALYARLMYKSTFRMPTFNDLYYRRIGNTSLRPEKANEYNAGLTWSFAGFGPLKYFSVTADGYYNDVTDKIVAFPSTYIWRMANFGKVHIKGIDLTLTAEIPVAAKVSAVIMAAFTHQKALDLTSRKSQTYKNDIPYTPRSYGSFNLTLNNPWVNVTWSTTYCGSRYSSAQNKPEYRMRSYAESTLSLYREFHFGKTRMKLQGSIVNVENKQYEVIQYYPMPRRNWTAAALFYF
jgi:vitamin B12 transporter